MRFDSLSYLIFLPAVALLHRFFPQRWRWLLLLAASLFFYASWNLPLTLLLLSVVAVSFFSGLLIARAASRRRRKLLLIISLAFCLGLLCYFKYFAFLARTLEALLNVFGTGVSFRLWDVLLPVGCSFYTFQALSYVIDVYRGKLPAETHPGYFALYISFFPQLVAGPIERAENLLPQLKADRRISREDIRQGLRLLLSGYFRKVVTADLCGRFADAVYAQTCPDGSAVFLGTLLFSFQIYCDFSGYSEIAAGSARLLGIRLMRNFERPYLSESLREFWRRWHISLGKWFTDYLYIPLGGSKNGMGRQLFATLLVFAFSGLWHGAGFHFLLWGLFHGLLISAGILWQRIREKSSIAGSFRTPPRSLRRLLTFSLVSFSWIFFRAGSASQAFAFIGAIFSPWDLKAGLSLMGLQFSDALLLLTSLLPLPILHRAAKGEKLPDLTFIYLFLAILLAWFLSLSQGTRNVFLYFQF